MAPDQRLRKDERLKSARKISALFNDGRSLVSFPVRFVWMLSERETGYPARAAFSVPRRRWKRAVDRNLFRRRMREAYRMHKHILKTPALPVDVQIFLSCIYIADSPSTFEQISASMEKGLSRIAERIVRDLKKTTAQ